MCRQRQCFGLASGSKACRLSQGPLDPVASFKSTKSDTKKRLFFMRDARLLGTRLDCRARIRPCWDTEGSVSLMACTPRLYFKTHGIYATDSGMENTLVVGWVAVISAKNHKCQRRKRQSVTAKREKSQTPKVLTAILTLPNLT